MNSHRSASLAVVTASLLFLPQCDMFKKQCASETSTGTGATSESGQALLTIGNNVEATVEGFEGWTEKFFTAQPQYKQFVEMNPELKKNLAESYLTERTLKAWVVNQGIHNTEEYKKELNDIIELGKQQLAAKYFQEKNPSTVTAADVRKYYDENKDVPGIKINDGGVATLSVKFAKQADAQAFFDAVKDASVDFEKAAKDKNLMVKNYKEVHSKRFDVAEPVRKQLEGVKKFPSVILVKVDDNNVEVVKAVKKEEAQYVPFEQVKEQIEGFLKQQNMANMFQFDSAEMQKIRKDLDVKVNTDAFEKAAGIKKEAPALSAEAQIETAGHAEMPAAPEQAQKAA